ncbi:hypothetical protein ROS217_06439 [Roseovarius sp. 217]|nr:hypothetical protein ROS217_06439 [Roseovarius sp. 217]
MKMFRKSIRLAAVMALPASVMVGGAPAWAQTPFDLNMFCNVSGHANGGQQRRVPFETRTTVGNATTLLTADGDAVFPEGDSFGTNPPNMLPTIYENAKTCRGNEIPNTLPSTPENPYNLHDDPVIRELDKTSPTDDLDWIMDRIEAMSEPQQICRNFRGTEHCYSYPRRVNPGEMRTLARRAVDIIEGNELQGRFSEREYEGFPLLHYLGGLKTKVVDPETKSVTVNQLWYDTHIESDAAYIDPIAVTDEEWTIKYVVKILNRGHEDFAPYAMFFDDWTELNLTDLGGPDLTAGGTAFPRVPNIGMDQTFFPMQEGLEYTLNMKMPPARFWNLSYHWGWRQHPPRVQVTENMRVPLRNGALRNTAESGVFGENPRASEEAKLAAIGMIGDTAPAKRMWQMFREMGGMTINSTNKHFGGGLNGSIIQAQMHLIRQAFDDWRNRGRLPTGYEMDPDADVTVLFLNNTIYGQLKGHNGDANVIMDDGVWDKRGDKVNIQLLNGDYYVHAYVLVDFGGLRGWENTFHNTLPSGGAGPLFTFGRNYFWIHVAGGGPIPVPPAARPEGAPNSPINDQSWQVANGNGVVPSNFEFAWGGMQQEMNDYVNVDGIGEHHLEVEFSYEPSRRLRMYQFDALHHDTAVWSVH